MDEIPYRASRILRALGNPIRYRILARLLREPATPGQLAREMMRPLPIISRHLTALKALDLVWFRSKPPSYLYLGKYETSRRILDEAEDCARRIRMHGPDPVAPSGTPLPS